MAKLCAQSQYSQSPDQSLLQLVQLTDPLKTTKATNRISVSTVMKMSRPSHTCRGRQLEAKASIVMFQSDREADVLKIEKTVTVSTTTEVLRVEVKPTPDTTIAMTTTTITMAQTEVGHCGSVKQEDSWNNKTTHGQDGGIVTTVPDTTTTITSP